MEENGGHGGGDGTQDMCIPGIRPLLHPPSVQFLQPLLPRARSLPGSAVSSRHSVADRTEKVPASWSLHSTGEVDLLQLISEVSNIIPHGSKCSEESQLCGGAGLSSS